MMNVFGHKLFGNRRGSMLIFTMMAMLALTVIAFEVGRNYVFTQKTRIASADKIQYYQMLNGVHAYFLNAIQKQLCLNPDAGFIPTLDAGGSPTGQCPSDWPTWFASNPTNTAGNNLLIPEKLLIGKEALQGINLQQGRPYDDTSWALGFTPLVIEFSPTAVAAAPLHPLAVLFGATSGMRASGNLQRVVVKMQRLQVADIPYDSGADTYIKYRVELHLAGIFSFLPQVLFVESIYGYHPIHNYKYALRVPGKLDLSANNANSEPYGIPRVPLSDLVKDSAGNLVGGLYFEGFTRSEGLVLPKPSQFSSVSLDTHLIDPPGIIEEATSSGTTQFTPRTAGATGGNRWSDLNWLGAKKIIDASYNDDGLATWAGRPGTTSTPFDLGKAQACADLGKSNTLDSTKATKVHVRERDGGNDRSGETLTSKFYIGFSKPNYFWPQGDAGITSRPEFPLAGSMTTDLESLTVSTAVDPWARVQLRYKVGSDWKETSALLGPTGEAKWTWDELDIDAATASERAAVDSTKAGFLQVMSNSTTTTDAMRNSIAAIVAANGDLDAKQTIMEDGAVQINNGKKNQRRNRASTRDSKFNDVSTTPSLCLSNCSSSNPEDITFTSSSALNTFISKVEDAVRYDRDDVWDKIDDIDNDSNTDYGADTSKKADRDGAYTTRKTLTGNSSTQFDQALAAYKAARDKINAYAGAKQALDDKMAELAPLIGGKLSLSVELRPHLYAGNVQRPILRGQIQVNGNRYGRWDKIEVTIIPFDGRYNLAAAKNAPADVLLAAEDAKFSYDLDLTPNRHYDSPNIPGNWTPISAAGNNSAVPSGRQPDENFDYASLGDECREDVATSTGNIELHDAGRTEQTWMAQADPTAASFGSSTVVFNASNATFATLGGDDRTMPNVTAARCEIRASAEVVVGYLNCMELEIMGGRSKPLYIVASINVVRQLTIRKNAIRNGIYWLNPHLSRRARYVLAQARMLGDGVDPNSCNNAWYGTWNNFMQVAMPLDRYQMFVRCETSVFVQSSSHLKGSSVDPGPMPHPIDSAGNIDKDYYRHVEYTTGQLSFHTNLMAN